MIPRLGINVDHVATLRQQRDEGYPCPAEAAKICLLNGADQITIHLREDRRHIQDGDVTRIKNLTSEMKKPLNLEMGCDNDIMEVALAVGPEWVCLVPEKREERTTEGGLDLKNEKTFEKVKKTCDILKSSHNQLKISLFLEADPRTLEKAVSIGPQIEAVEVHTGDFAKSFLNNKDYQNDLTSYEKAKKFLNLNNIGCHAGHGLTKESVLPLLERELFEEYNIGHWVISQSIFDGLQNVVGSFRDLFQKFPVQN